jgi:hypothetical protein
MKQVIKKTFIVGMLLLVIGMVSGTMRTTACDKKLTTNLFPAEKKEQPAPLKTKVHSFPDFILGHSILDI